MSNNFYNLIMASVPEFYSGNKGEFQIPKDRFLEYTEDHIKGEFQSLDQDVIERLKSLPAIFATEDEVADARIGKIIDIEVHPNALKVKYKFDEDRYPLTSGVLKENWQKLGIRESGYEFHRGHWGIKECDLSDFYEEYLKSLTGIAHQLKNSDKKVQLIYAFNGTGKTRLSRELKDLIAPKTEADEGAADRLIKVLYYNAFTEDLFYWDNDLDGDTERKLKIQPNSFTDWILKDQGQDRNIITNFQRYTNDKLTPNFNAEYKIPDQNDKNKEITIPAFSEVTFSLERGDDTGLDNIKISKGEESNFIWSIFYTLLEQVIAVLNEVNPDAPEKTPFDQLEYVFIDDPVSSLDENHLIELAQSLATLIKSSPADGPKFIITTHNPLFYTVLFHALKKGLKYRLSNNEDGSFSLERQETDSPFSYHLHLIEKLKSASEQNEFEKYHYNLLRNVLEKTSTFLGYDNWSDLLPKTADGKSDAYLKRIVDISSHSKHSGYELSELSQDDKRVLRFLLGATANKKYEFPERYQVDLKESTTDDTAN